MAEETEKKIDENKAAKSAVEKQGADAADLSEGQGTGGAPKAPDVSNKPPVKELTAEEKKAADTAKAEAAKKTGDEDTEETEEAPKVKDFGTYEDDNASSAISLLKEAGVTPDEAASYFSKAIQTGKLEDIDMQAMIKKIGKEKATAVLSLSTAFYNKNMAETQNRVKSVVAAAGGEQSFVKVRDFIRSEAQKNPELKKQAGEWIKMFDLNDKTALLAVSEMVEIYNKDPRHKSLQINMVHGDRSGTEVGVHTGETLSRGDYLAKVKVAEAKGDMQEVSRLRALRKASR